MSARQLIRLWISEGFIEQDPRRKAEDVVEEYLEDLVDRSLIMVVKRRSDGGIKSCCIHDILRDLCLSEGVRDNFLVVHNGKGFAKSSNDRPRRLSVHFNISRYTSLMPCDSSLVRTLLCFGDKESVEAKNNLSLSKDFRLVRVLDLGQSRFKEIPPKFEKLVLLRYLCIKGAVFNTGIPAFICNLPNLQTLDLRESSVTLDVKFWNMQQLRHLFLSGSSEFLWTFNSSTRIKTMWNLQTLSGVSSNFVFLIRESNAFPNLRKLGAQAAASSSCYNSGYANMSMTCEPSFESIQTLKIIKGSHFLTHSGALSSRLTKLTLVSTKLQFQDLYYLRLPNLETLKLMKDSIVGTSEYICWTNSYFGKLQVLHMVELNVTGFWVGGESVSNLRYLVINKCRNLKTVPDELKNVTTLRHVKLSWCSPKLEECLRPLGQRDNVHLEIQSYK